MVIVSIDELISITQVLPVEMQFRLFNFSSFCEKQIKVLHCFPPHQWARTLPKQTTGLRDSANRTASHIGVCKTEVLENLACSAVEVQNI